MVRGINNQSQEDQLDEIPIAKRQNIQKSSQRFLRTPLSLFFLFGVGIYIGLAYVNIPVLKFVFNSFGITSQEGPAPQKQLLGHLAYSDTTTNQLIEIQPGILVHIELEKDLRDLINAAYLDGIDLVLLSGYRSISLQKEIFYQNKSIRNQTAIERARVSAPPGYSEHSTGYAIDFGDSTMPETHFEQSFENTPAFNWLKRNAPRYHFVLSFPDGNSQGVSYEPWHWRFEGTVEALQKFENANKILRLDINQ